jgi:hypothetical protein
VIEERVVPVGVPDALADIAARWRMFYMHYYAAMGLEAAFKGITGLADGAGLRGVEFTEVLEALGTVAATKRLAKHLGVALPKSMLDLSWMELARAAGVNLEVLDGSGVLDSAAGGTWRLAERRLTDLVGRRSKAGYPEILATGIVLLTTTLARLRRWEETPYGTWLAGASDNVRDVTPAVVSTWLRQRYQRWWTC